MRARLSALGLVLALASEPARANETRSLQEHLGPAFAVAKSGDGLSIVFRMHEIPIGTSWTGTGVWQETSRHLGRAILWLNTTGSTLAAIHWRTDLIEDGATQSLTMDVDAKAARDVRGSLLPDD